MVTVSPLKRALTVDTKEPRPTFSSFTSSRPDVFCRKGVLRNFANFTGKYLCQSNFLNKVTGLKFIKKRDSGTGVFL